MDMMETIELEDLGDQTRQMLEELMGVVLLKPRRILVVGCSPSGIDSFEIGSHSGTEIGIAVYTALYQELKPRGIYLVAQCCEYLNHTLILEIEAAQAYGYEPMNMVPQLKAGGSFATAAYTALEHPVAVEHIRAHVGIDIGDTLISMHMKGAVVPVWIKAKEIRNAHVICARIRPKFTDGIRTRYDEENM